MVPVVPVVVCALSPSTGSAPCSPARVSELLLETVPARKGWWSNAEMGHQEARPLLQVVSETRTHCIAQPELRTHRLLGKYVGRQASWLRHLNRQRIGFYRLGSTCSQTLTLK